MTLTNYLVDAYIDVNILLIIALTIWATTRFILLRLGFSQAFCLQLRLLNGVFVAVAFSPLFVMAFDFLLQKGAVAQTYALGLSDLVLAQYLSGGFSMQPSRLEHLLGLRGELITGFVDFKTTGAMIVVAMAFVGFVLVLLRLIHSIWTLERIVQNSFEWRRFGNLHLRVSDRIHVPFSTRGLKRRYIVFPSAMLAHSDDLKMALAHEFQHLRQGDIEWEIALEALRPLFFWNPAFIFGKRQVEQLRELSCDQSVVRSTQFDGHAYCECLLRVCRNGLHPGAQRVLLVSSVPFVQVETSFLGVNSVDFLRRRMASVFDAEQVPQGDSLSRYLQGLLMSLVILISIGLTCQSDWSQDRLMFSAIVNLERLHGPIQFGG
jgi:hypothetical protein